MLIALWEVKMDYAFSYGGMTQHGTFYVSGENIGEASNKALRYMESSTYFDKEILNIKKFSDAYYSETSVD